MSNFALIEALFLSLLNASKEVLAEAHLAEVQSFIEVGEYGLALETVADIYADEKKTPSAEVVALIEKLALDMSMKPSEVLERLHW